MRRAGHVLARDHDRQLEADEAGGGQVLHRSRSRWHTTRAADAVVDRSGRPVERDLHVDVVGARDPAARLGVIREPLVENFTPTWCATRSRQLPEVAADGRLAAADVHVEHLHALELVDHRHALRGAQLARVAPTRARQAVHARKVARVGQLPGQADRGIQPLIEAIYQPIGAYRRSADWLAVQRHQ